MVRAVASQKWGYVRIITGTIVGGILGFYVMHRLEVRHKEKMNERLKNYEIELKKREKMNEVEESLGCRGFAMLNSDAALKQFHQNGN